MEMETRNRIKPLFALFFLGAMIVLAVIVLKFRNSAPSISQLQTATPAAISSVEPTLDQPVTVLPNTGDTGSVQIPVYDTLELVFQAESTPDNPFDTYLLKLEVTDPDGRVFAVEGFYDGDGKGGQNGKVWKARLTPYKAGNWAWRTVKADAPDGKIQGLSGKFTAADQGNLGGLVRDGKHFAFQSGSPVFLGGNFLDFTNGLRTTHTFMSETTNDGQRQAILERQKNFHAANKANIYFANKGDYDNQSVTPWLGSAGDNDKTRMDLSRWKKYDAYLQEFKKNRMFAEMWFFADDSNFGGVDKAHKNRLVRYAMARTSAYSHTLYVLALEWQEDWSKSGVRELGQYLQAHNPWDRMVSVHSLTLTDWAFGGDDWADFFASQPGNDTSMDRVSSFNVQINRNVALPHLSEEFGILRDNSSAPLRNRMWASLAGGAAGTGTGSDLKAMMRFLQASRMPFQRMEPANQWVNGGGKTHFALAENSHHYLVYSSGGSIEMQLEKGNYQGYWFNPRDAKGELIGPFDVGGGQQRFTPPSDEGKDWVLWITDGSNLNPGELYPSAGQGLVSIPVSGSASGGNPGPQPTPTVSPPPPSPREGLGYKVFLPFTAGE